MPAALPARAAAWETKSAAWRTGTGLYEYSLAHCDSRLHTCLHPSYRTHLQHTFAVIDYMYLLSTIMINCYQNVCLVLRTCDVCRYSPLCYVGFDMVDVVVAVSPASVLSNNSINV